MRQIYIVIYIYIFPEALSEEKDKYLTVVDQICSQSSGRIAFCVCVCFCGCVCVARTVWMLLFSLEISLAGEGSDVVWSIRSFVQNLVQCIKMFVFFS